MSDLHLYGAFHSGHSYKIRLMLLLAGLKHDYTAMDLTQPREQRPEAFKAVAQFGEVPVLLDGSQIVIQSNAILLHLARKHNAFEAGSVLESHWNEITSWLFWEANRIGRSYANLRYCRLFDTSVPPALVSWFESTAIDDLARLDAELSDKRFLLGELTIADLSCAGYLLYGDDIGLDMTRWPNVTRWLDAIRALPHWQHPYDIMGQSV
jgi:glutathione S-transferase